MTSSILLLIFPALMVFAAFYDCMSLRITNGLCLLIAALFLPAAIIAELPVQVIFSHIACAAVILALAFIFFARGWIGGGDAKLLAAAALWFGWGNIADFVTVAALAGGMLALGVLAVRALHICLSTKGAGPFAAKAELPYGVAMACGALAVYPHTPWIVATIS